MPLQGLFVHPSTHATISDAYLVLDDVVVSLASQIAALHFSVYWSQAARDAGGDPVFSDHTEALAPAFSQITLGPLAAGSLDAQIRQAAYQWLLALPPYNGWSVVA